MELSTKKRKRRRGKEETRGTVERRKHDGRAIISLAPSLQNICGLPTTHVSFTTAFIVDHGDKRQGISA